MIYNTNKQIGLLNIAPTSRQSYQTIPHPLRFFVPSQLVRALSEPPPP